MKLLSSNLEIIPKIIISDDQDVYLMVFSPGGRRFNSSHRLSTSPFRRAVLATVSLLNVIHVVLISKGTELWKRHRRCLCEANPKYKICWIRFAGRKFPTLKIPFTIANLMQCLQKSSFIWIGKYCHTSDIKYPTSWNDSSHLTVT